MAGSAITTSVTLTRLLGTPQDLARKAHALLADRFAPARVRHKPLSILRQEARRALDQLFDTDFPAAKKADRDRVIEEVLGEAAGFGPLEELFRDEGYAEVMVLAANQVIAKKGDGWLPTSVRFRDPAHLRSYLQRLADTGEQVGTIPAPTGGFDVRMTNGFRVIGVLPPAVMDQPPTAVFVRGEPPAAEPLTGPPRSLLLAPSQRTGSIINTPRPIATDGSSIAPVSATTRVIPPAPAPPPPTAANNAASASMMGGMIAPRATPAPPPPPPAGPDRYAKVRQRVAERIVRKCAAAGVYDMSVISTPELQRIILAHIDELNGIERLGLDEVLMQRLTLEILAGMNR